MVKFLVFLGLCLLGFSSAEEMYNKHLGSQVIRIAGGHNREQMDILVNQLGGVVDFWLEPSTVRPTDIQVPFAHLKKVKEFLEKNTFKYSVMIADVGALIGIQHRISANKKRQSGMNWDDYQRYDTIMTFLDEVAEKYPDIATVETYGKSGEGRDLKVIKIGRNGTGKPAFFLDGGMHAREWIGPATVTYFINELTENQSNNQEVLDTVDIYITPIANPDGYEWSHMNVNNRLWRKTRSNHDSVFGCLGVDPNRNFEVEFGGPGTSTDKCSDIYHGPRPFSEPETASMAEFVWKKKLDENVNWTAYFAIHSYAQMWLVPWGWTDELPPTYSELREFGEEGAGALTSVHGTIYEVGSVTELLTPGAGGSDDWAYGTNLFRYSQTVEVRDTGRFGFLLPPVQIIPTAEETWAAIKATARYVTNNRK